MSMEPILSVIKDNAEWIFSGIGVSVAAVTANYLYLLVKRPHVLYAPSDYKQKPSERSAASLNELSSKLESISLEIDAAMQTLSSEITERQEAIEGLKKQNETLSEEEEKLQTRVNALKDVPLEVAEYFQRINSEHLRELEKRSSKRDVGMFVLGIFVTTIVSIAVGILVG